MLMFQQFKSINTEGFDQELSQFLQSLSNKDVYYARFVPFVKLCITSF